jgi:hypothetical protein
MGSTLKKRGRYASLKKYLPYLIQLLTVAKIVVEILNMVHKTA